MNVCDLSSLYPLAFRMASAALSSASNWTKAKPSVAPDSSLGRFSPSSAIVPTCRAQKAEAGSAGNWNAGRRCCRRCRLMQSHRQHPGAHVLRLNSRCRDHAPQRARHCPVSTRVNPTASAAHLREELAQEIE